MKKYYVRNIAQENGDYEVHKEGCFWLPLPKNRTYLGLFNNCEDAVKEAKNYHSQVDGCKHCSGNCHTS